jgi:hypothetical protein
MRRLAFALFTVPALVAAPAGARAQGDAGGFVESDEARVEVLAAPARVGERIERAEGWYRVEEAGREDRAVGSFGIVPAAELTAAPEPVRELPRAEPAGPTAAQLGLSPEDRIPAPMDARGEGPAYALADPCRAERTAYLRALLRTEGIDFDDPVGLFEGIEGDAFARGFNWYWLSLRVDPIRPLAWNSDLRALARELARCANDR